ncbi:MICOS subunit Mic26p [[Candida] anglica]|uniref:MICOS complex subunit n=1 Tax=[Candida] anglica TaxID=148631 RepID=A0ABP0EGE0_9ASCO
MIGPTTFRAATVVGGSVGSLLLMKSPIANDSKRRFYEDETEVVPVPGTVTPSSGTELEILGQNRLIDGISVRSPSSLESAFKTIRESVVDVYNQGRAYLDTTYVQYHETERKVTNTVSQLHAKQEDLLPNSIYVLVAALSGNILARQRNIVAKATFPVVLGLASFKYFLPETFGRTTGFVWSLEKQNLPHLAQQQELAVAKTNELVTTIGQSTETGQKKLQSGVQSLRSSIAGITGLNLDEEVSKK